MKRKLKVNIYCYDCNGKMYKRIDNKSFEKIEEVDDCLIVTFTKHDCIILKKYEIATIFIH